MSGASSKSQAPSSKDLRDVPYWKLSYEERMQVRKERRQADPAFQARLAEQAARVEARRQLLRSQEIWGAIRAYDQAKAEANQLRATPAQRSQLRS